MIKKYNKNPPNNILAANFSSMSIGIEKLIIVTLDFNQVTNFNNQEK